MESRDVLIKELVTLRDYLRWGVSHFSRAGIYFGHGTDNALDEALQLIQYALKLPPEVATDMLLDARLTREERALILVLFDTRVQERIPVPYLTGQAWFAGYRFRVDERVLIPRSPIAELVESGFQPWLGGQPLRRILDLCSGSGCIGIACALYDSEVQVDLLDISEPALEVARQNIRDYTLEARVEARQSDLFSSLDPRHDRYELIVCNPPYVDAEDLAAMPAEYRHEPVLALQAGVDGLDFCRRIFASAADYLEPGGLLVLELGNSGMRLEEIYPEIPFMWVEFQRGGQGVLVMTQADLLEYAPLLARLAE